MLGQVNPANPWFQVKVSSDKGAAQAGQGGEGTERWTEEAGGAGEGGGGLPFSSGSDPRLSPSTPPHILPLTLGSQTPQGQSLHPLRFQPHLFLSLSPSEPGSPGFLALL